MEMAPQVEELKASNYSCRVYISLTANSRLRARILLSSLTNVQLQYLTDDFENQVMQLNDEAQRTQAEKSLFEAYQSFYLTKSDIEFSCRISSIQRSYEEKQLILALCILFRFLELAAYSIFPNEKIDRSVLIELDTLEIAFFYLFVIDDCLKRSFRQKYPLDSRKNGGICEKLKECGAWFKQTRFVDSAREKWIRMFPPQTRISQEESLEDCIL